MLFCIRFATIHLHRTMASYVPQHLSRYRSKSSCDNQQYTQLTTKLEKLQQVQHENFLKVMNALTSVQNNQILNGEACSLGKGIDDCDTSIDSDDWYDVEGQCIHKATTSRIPFMTKCDNIYTKILRGRTACNQSYEEYNCNVQSVLRDSAQFTPQTNWNPDTCMHVNDYCNEQHIVELFASMYKEYLKPANRHRVLCESLKYQTVPLLYFLKKYTRSPPSSDTESDEEEPIPTPPTTEPSTAFRITSTHATNIQQQTSNSEPIIKPHETEASAAMNTDTANRGITSIITAPPEPCKAQNAHFRQNDPTGASHKELNAVKKCIGWGTSCSKEILRLIQLQDEERELRERQLAENLNCGLSMTTEVPADIPTAATTDTCTLNLEWDPRDVLRKLLLRRQRKDRFSRRHRLSRNTHTRTVPYKSKCNSNSEAPTSEDTVPVDQEDDLNRVFVKQFPTIFPFLSKFQKMSALLVINCYKLLFVSYILESGKEEVNIYRELSVEQSVQIITSITMELNSTLFTDCSTIIKDQNKQTKKQIDVLYDTCTRNQFPEWSSEANAYTSAQELRTMWDITQVLGSLMQTLDWNFLCQLIRITNVAWIVLNPVTRDIYIFNKQFYFIEKPQYILVEYYYGNIKLLSPIKSTQYLHSS